jgi:hypothetical protein
MAGPPFPGAVTVDETDACFISAIATGRRPATLFRG